MNDQTQTAAQKLFFVYNQIRNDLNNDFNRQISYLEKLKYNSIRELDNAFYTQIDLLEQQSNKPK